MKTKILKNKVTIELTTNEYDDMFKYINKLSNMLSTLHETNDLWLSDVHNLDSLQYDLVKLLDAKWDAGSYRYVKRG
jgi:hypothetical protein